MSGVLMTNLGFSALILMLLFPMSVPAVTPQFWEDFTQADLLQGSLDHMSLTAEGKLYVSRTYDMIFDTEQPYVFSLIQDSKGNIYAGTGDDGKVFRIDSEGKGTLFFEAEEINIFSMAVDSSDTLYVGSSPDGKVFKVTGPNQASEFFDIDDKYIWAMVFDEQDNLYIGTGGGGAIYKVDPEGVGKVFYKCGDTHVRSLARSGSGNLLAGTSPNGLLIEIDGEGKGFTLADTPMEEVHSLAFDAYGGIYAVASSSGIRTESTTGLKNTAAESEQTATAMILIDSVVGVRNKASGTSTVSVPGGGAVSTGTRSAVYLISRDGGMETVYSSRTQMVFDSVVCSDGSLLLATSPKGRLLSIDASKQVTVVSDASEEHLTQLLAEGDTVYAGSSNQGKIFRLGTGRASKGVFESDILDAKVAASWGKIFWNVSNPRGTRFELSTRTGNTGKIDNTWSDWSASYKKPGQQITSPKARYLQWRVSVRGSSSSKEEPLSDLLEGVRIAYLQKNLRPEVTKIEVLPSGVEIQKQPSLSISAVSLSVQTSTPDGRSLNAPRERGKNMPETSPRQILQPGAQSFTWEATDGNQDSLEYSIYFKGESERDWKLLEKKYTDTYYTIYSASLPDGLYRLKIVASDAPSNPYGSYLVGELVSRPFLVANTPPQVEITDSEINAKKVEVEFKACVSAGNIATSEFSIDGNEWHLVFPKDGIADSRCEEYKFSTTELNFGEHMISIRASNRDGNTGVSKVVVQIP